MDKEKVIKVLGMIADDAEKDVNEAEGKPFTGRNVSEFNGKQNAMIRKLALTLKEILEDEK